MSSEDSNESNVTDNNSLASQSGRESANMSQSSANVNASIFANELKKLENPNDAFQCDKCHLEFSRFDLWREHQLVHLMNPTLFPSSFSPESPFGILQNVNEQQISQSQSSNQQQQLQRDRERAEREMKDSFTESNSAASSLAGDTIIMQKRKYSADEQTDDPDSEQPRDKRLRTTILPEQLEFLYTR